MTSGGTNPKLEYIDLVGSKLLDVIYDDESVILELDFCLLEGHSRFEADSNGTCMRKGFISFAEIDDLRLNQAQEETADESNIASATIDDDYALIDSGWGEIELTARSIRVVVD